MKPFGQISFGMNFRTPLTKWIFENLEAFDCLEVMVDHYIYGGERTRSILHQLADRVPLIGHGVGLSIGTDAPLDEGYLEQVAETLTRLGIKEYSEHLAFTKTDKIDLANLLPLPRSDQFVESVVPRIRLVQSVVPASFSLENISYLFEFPGSHLTDAEVFNILYQETGVGMLLDLENLHVNSTNHRFDAEDFVASIPRGMVRGIHIAGGPVVHRSYLAQHVLVDTHSDRVPAEVYQLFSKTLELHCPKTVILERDDDALGQREDIIEDLQKARGVFQSVQTSATP